MRLLPPVNTAQSAVPMLTPLSDAQLARNSSEQPAPSSQQTPYPTVTQAPLPKIQSDALAVELDTLYKSVMGSLGQEEAKYIQRIYANVVYRELVARGLLAVAGRQSSRLLQKGT